MIEGKTLITFFSNNDETCYNMDCEGVDSGELLKLCGMLDMAKMKILQGIDKHAMDEDL